MSVTVTTATPAAPRRRWQMRFSLRTLMIVVTVLCLTIAPLLPELNHERDVLRQVKLIEAMGGKCVFVDRPPGLSTHLARRVWPVRLAHLDHDLLMAEFNNQSIDPAKLAQAPDLRGVCFSDCWFSTVSPGVRCPQVEYVQLRQNFAPNIRSNLPGNALACFSGMRKARLIGVPQDQEFFDALGRCTRLQELEVEVLPHEPQVIDLAPLGNLQQLRNLKISQTRGVLDWSWLSHLQPLKEVEIGSDYGGFVDFTSLASVGHQVEPDRTPSSALGKLTHVHHVRVHQVKIPLPDIQAMAAANEVETFLLPKIQQVAALKEVCREPSLRAVEGIHAELDQDREEIFRILSDARQLREVSIWFLKLDDDILERLTKLSHIQRWSLSFDLERAVVSPRGLATFQKLPIAHLQTPPTDLPPGWMPPLGPGVRKLIDDWHSRKLPDTPIRESDEGVEFFTQSRNKDEPRTVRQLRGARPTSFSPRSLL